MRRSWSMATRICLSVVWRWNVQGFVTRLRARCLRLGSCESVGWTWIAREWTKVLCLLLLGLWLCLCLTLEFLMRGMMDSVRGAILLFALRGSWNLCGGVFRWLWRARQRRCCLGWARWC
eukprot:07318_4